MKTLILTALLLTACGHQVPLACVTTGNVKADSYTFQTSPQGIFVKGTIWTADTALDSCGRVLNATLTNTDASVTIIVTNGVPVVQ